MGLKDKRGVPVSTTNQESLEGLEHAFGLFQGFFGDPYEAINEVLEKDPDFIMGHCFRAGMIMASSEKGAVPDLRESVEAVEGRFDLANDREKGHAAAARAWLDGNFHRATEIYGDLLAAFPRDGIALQCAHLCDFLLGQSQMLRDRVSRVLPEWDENVPGFGYLHGMHAFGLEEMGEYGRAEESGRKAVEMNPNDTWAIHAVAHVMEMQGRLDEGVDWLTTRTDDWSPDNGFAFHNWWHLSLYHLDVGQLQDVMRIYDEHIRPAPSEVAMELVDASALLWRLYLQGVDVGRRWADIADTFEPMKEDAYYVFNDMHAMMAFVADDRPGSADRVMASVRRAAEAKDSNGAMTRDVGLPACEAIEAFGKGDYETTVERLLNLRPIAHRFGGSHAQRDILSQTLIEAALRDGQFKLAKSLANERTVWKPTSPLGWKYEARAKAGLIQRSSGRAA